jgi:hypothetical protein
MSVKLLCQALKFPFESLSRFLLVFAELVAYKKGMKKNLCVLCASKERSEWAVKFAL